MPKSYKGITFNGSTFPDSPYKTVPVKLNVELINEYLPALLRVLPNGPKGFQLLLTGMTFQEGFTKKSRSYKNNNPGNIGNTDSGANAKLPTLDAGIQLQVKYINDIISGKSKAFPMGKPVVIAPYYSAEIAKNPQYGLNPNLPGYKFTFTGQLDQFVKIYSTGARATNSYINVIVSFFASQHLNIQPDSKLQDIIKMV